MAKDKEIYLVAAHDDGGFLTAEVFEDPNEALEFEKPENMVKHLEELYEVVFDMEHVHIVLHKMILRKAKKKK